MRFVVRVAYEGRVPPVAAMGDGVWAVGHDDPGVPGHVHTLSPRVPRVKRVGGGAGPGRSGAEEFPAGLPAFPLASVRQGPYKYATCMRLGRLLGCPQGRRNGRGDGNSL